MTMRAMIKISMVNKTMMTMMMEVKAKRTKVSVGNRKVLKKARAKTRRNKRNKRKNNDQECDLKILFVSFINFSYLNHLFFMIFMF